jgi:hypothetical protein
LFASVSKAKQQLRFCKNVSAKAVTLQLPRVSGI